MAVKSRERSVTLRQHVLLKVSKKVMFSHTRYRVLGQELIPVNRQSACRRFYEVIPGGSLHYFLPACGHLPSRHHPSTSTNLYCLAVDDDDDDDDDDEHTTAVTGLEQSDLVVLANCLKSRQVFSELDNKSCDDDSHLDHVPKDHVNVAGWLH